MLFVVWAAETPDATTFFDRHSGSLTILALVAMVLFALLILVPQLLKSRQRYLELQHEQRMRALEKGQNLPRNDERSVAAGRTAVLVPSVVICTAGTVTCFLVAFRSEDAFSVALATWSVAGVVSLAAITGGVALMGRLAHLHETGEDEPLPEEAPDKDEVAR